MKVRSASSQHTDIKLLLADIKHQLVGVCPTLLVVAFDSVLSGEALIAEFEQVFSCPIIGSSSCKGALHIGQQRCEGQVKIAVLAVDDAEGNYGVGYCTVDPEEIEQSARNALDMALYASGRGYESPALIWSITPPGAEERVIEGYQDVVGKSVPILGGSSADNDISGNWQQLTSLTADSNQIVVLVLYPSRPIGHFFSSGYQPGAHTVTVTSSTGRHLKTLNDYPAANFYNELTEFSIHDHLQGGSVLSRTTLHPFGRRIQSGSNVEEYVLVHPHAVTNEGGLALFSDIKAGEELSIMNASLNSLICRAEKVVEHALDLMDEEAVPIGILMVFCAGCMLAIEPSLDEMLANLHDAYPELPIVGFYTYGEQGCFLDGVSRHGNLMISALVFSE